MQPTPTATILPSSIKPENRCNAPYRAIATIIAGLAGGVLVTLGMLSFFGPVASVGFIGSTAGGGVLILAACVSLVWMAIGQCKKANSEEKTVHFDDFDQASDSESEDKMPISTPTQVSSFTPPLEAKPIQQSVPEKVLNALKMQTFDHSFSTMGDEIIKTSLEFADLAKQDTLPADLKRSDDTLEPITPQIAILKSSLYKITSEFASRVIANTAWEDPEFMKLADLFFNVSYALSCLTLLELIAYNAKLKERGIHQTLEETLSNQYNYCFLTFFDCSKTYHYLRGKVSVCEHIVSNPHYDRNDPQSKRTMLKPVMGFPLEHQIPTDYADLFYKEGTPQYAWRALYEDFRYRLQLTVNLEALYKEDKRFIHWVQPDDDRDTFKYEPDRLPT